MNIKSKFRFKQIVKHKLGDEPYFLDSIAIYSHGSILYGCLDKEGNTKWFKEYELEGEAMPGKMGYNISIGEK